MEPSGVLLTSSGVLWFSFSLQGNSTEEGGGASSAPAAVRTVSDEAEELRPAAVLWVLWVLQDRHST